MDTRGAARRQDRQRHSHLRRRSDPRKIALGVASAEPIVLELLASPSGNAGALTVNLPPILAAAGLMMQPGNVVQQFAVTVGQMVTIGYNGPMTGLPAPLPYPANAKAGTPAPTNPAWNNARKAVGTLTPINGGLQATYLALAAGDDSIACTLTQGGQFTVMIANMEVAA